jgi:hypothetical protein
MSIKFKLEILEKELNAEKENNIKLSEELCTTREQKWTLEQELNQPNSILEYVFNQGLFNIQAGGQMPPSQSPLVPPHEITFCPPPQEKSLFPKIMQTNQWRITNR